MAARGDRGLTPFYIASAILTVGEGSLLVLIGPYLETKGVKEGIIGVIVASYGVTSLLVRIPAGAAYRSHHLTRHIAGGCLLMAAAFACIPLADHPLSVGALVGLDGMGFAVATTAAMAGLMERRPAESSAASIMGWYAGSIGAGYALAGFVAGSVADAWGIEAAFIAMAGLPIVGGAALARSMRGAASQGGPAPPRVTFTLSGFRSAHRSVWIAFAVSLYINLTSGVTFTFFPLYGLAIGLSLTQIGALAGIHGAVAAIVRFGSVLLFRRLPYERSLGIMIALSGVGVAALAGSETFFVLALAWGTIGLTRGILRVASGALVLDTAGASEGERGAASGIYLAGLDLGKIAGPIVGGVFAETIGVRGTFVAVGLLFPVMYMTLTAWLARKRSKDIVRESPSTYTDDDGDVWSG